MTKTRSGQSGPALNGRVRGVWCRPMAGLEPAWGPRGARVGSHASHASHASHFSKNCPQDQKWSRETRPLRWSTMFAKNQVLKLNIDKVTVILDLNSPLWATPPVALKAVWFLAFDRWRENQLIKLIKCAQLIKCAENNNGRKTHPQHPPPPHYMKLLELNLVYCRDWYLNRYQITQDIPGLAPCVKLHMDIIMDIMCTYPLCTGIRTRIPYKSALYVILHMTWRANAGICPITNQPLDLQLYL
jgi:hypothetical protein